MVVEVTTMQEDGMPQHLDPCPMCGGEGVDDSWVVDGHMAMATCGRCMGTGSASPVAVKVRRVYARNAERMTPEQRALLANAVKLLIQLETGAE